MRKICVLLFTSVLLIAYGCSSGKLPEPGSGLRDFESTWQTADTYYPHFALKLIDWDEVYQRLLPLKQQAKGSDIDTVLNRYNSVDLVVEIPF